MASITAVRAGSLALGALFLACGASCSNGSNGGSPAPARPEPTVSADLEPFLESYFATWSRGDMEGYRDHFLPESTVYLVRGGQVLAALPLAPFIEGQASAQLEGQRGVERMTSFRALEDRQAASVVVDWELTEGRERTVGVDRFTLIRDDRWHWKIATLLYYSTDRGRVREGEAPSKSR